MSLKIGWIGNRKSRQRHIEMESSGKYNHNLIQ